MHRVKISFLILYHCGEEKQNKSLDFFFRKYRENTYLRRIPQKSFNIENPEYLDRYFAATKGT